MNINSLISSSTSVRGFTAPEPSRQVNAFTEPAADAVTYDRDRPAGRTVPNYSRATASGAMLKPASPADVQSPPSAAEQGKPSGNSDIADGQAEGSRGQISSAPKDSYGEPLNSSEQEVLAQLQKIDQSVHTHEMAHLSAAGGYARSGASYSYKRGPDGRDYAVGGEVMIDTSPAATPEATMAKMQVVRRAALAPADPSGQDQRVAAQATVQIAKAAQELVQLAAQSQAVDNPSDGVEKTTSADDRQTTPGQIYSQAAPTSVSGHNRPAARSSQGYNLNLPRQSSVSHSLNIVA